MIIVKIGGGNQIDLSSIISDLAQLNEPMILIHGANGLRNNLAERLGESLETVTSISGHSSVLSDERVIDLQMMAYAGLQNKRLVALCQRHGINAVGLSGLDGGLVRGRRNRGIRVRRNGKKMLLHDFSGKPVELNTGLLLTLLGHGYTPVLSVPILDENGHAINSENDEIASLLLSEFRAKCLIQLIEAPGLLRDPDDPGSVVNDLDPAELVHWETRLQGRMRRKILALKKIFERHNPVVHIGDGRVSGPVSSLLAGGGTRIARPVAASA